MWEISAREYLLMGGPIMGPLVLVALSGLVASFETRAERREVVLAGADQAPAGTNRLIVVTATRLDMPANAVASSISVVTPEQLEARRRPAGAAAKPESWTTVPAAVPTALCAAAAALFTAATAAGAVPRVEQVAGLFLVGHFRSTPS